jgi:hypothetical protein
MGLEQRVGNSKRAARNSFYRWQAEHGNTNNITNWRMILARKFKIPITEVRRILGEE